MARRLKAPVASTLPSPSTSPACVLQSTSLPNSIGMATIALAIRLALGKGAAFGPGKAALLQGIRETGSIAAAGRRMKMSYSRAWGLVEQMNHQFREPLVDSTKGGAARGGA